MSGGHRKVQDFPFVGRRASRDEKPDDLSFEVRDGHVIAGWIPTGSLRADALNGRDGGAVAFTGGSDDHYFFGA
jgi:hypothetical protein